jgi:hypothetical protein
VLAKAGQFGRPTHAIIPPVDARAGPPLELLMEEIAVHAEQNPRWLDHATLVSDPHLKPCLHHPRWIAPGTIR